MENLFISVYKSHNPQSINSANVTLVCYLFPFMKPPCVTGSILVYKWYLEIYCGNFIPSPQLDIVQGYLK